MVEVRRQFKEIAGIMEGKADPDYASCVALCTKGALHEMVVPALLAIIVPIVTGLVLGPTGVVGLLGGVSVTGFAMAVFMSNAGGAWDNAKKYIESGHHGGKGSEQHKAAVVGDTVGDPFKDTSGPSLNILIKLWGRGAPPPGGGSGQGNQGHLRPHPRCGLVCSPAGRLQADPQRQGRHHRGGPGGDPGLLRHDPLRRHGL